MAVVVYIESENGTPKKAGLEVASYGRALADAHGVSLVAVGFNLTDHERIKCLWSGQIVQHRYPGSGSF